MNPDISKWSIEKLKAFAYDCLVVIEQNQNNLKLLNQELTKRKMNPENEEIKPQEESQTEAPEAPAEESAEVEEEKTNPEASEAPAN